MIIYFLTASVEFVVIETSRSELTSQIVKNSLFVMREAAAVFDLRLADGFAVLVQPIAFTTSRRAG